MRIDVMLDHRDFWHFNRFTYQHTTMGRWTFLIIALTVPVLAFAVSGLEAGSPGMVALMALVTSVWWLLLPWVLRLRARATFRRFPDHFRVATVTIGEKGFIWKGPTKADTLSWRAIRRVVQDRHAFYFFVDAQRAYIVPFRAFAGPEEARAFAEAALDYRRKAFANRRAA